MVMVALTDEQVAVLRQRGLTSDEEIRQVMLKGMGTLFDLYDVTNDGQLVVLRPGAKVRGRFRRITLDIDT